MLCCVPQNKFNLGFLPRDSLQRRYLLLVYEHCFVIRKVVSYTISYNKREVSTLKPQFVLCCSYAAIRECVDV